MEEKDLQQIEEYIGGELKGEQLAQFEQRLKSDPDLATEVDLHRQAEEWLQKQRREEHWRALIQEQRGGQTKLQIRRLYPLIAGIAASLLLVIIAIWWVQRPVSLDVLADNYWQETEQFVYDVDRNTQTLEEQRQQLQQAFTSYNDKKYQESLNTLQQVATLPEQGLFLQGANQFALKQYAAARTTFEMLYTDDRYFDKGQARWYLALTNLKLNQKAEAQLLLEEIITEKGWNAQMAEELLKKL